MSNAARPFPVCTGCGHVQLPSGNEVRQCPDCGGYEWRAGTEVGE